jgi:hypothetical protein
MSCEQLWIARVIRSIGVATSMGGCGGSRTIVVMPDAVGQIGDRWRAKRCSSTTTDPIQAGVPLRMVRTFTIDRGFNPGKYPACLGNVICT